MTSSLLKIDGVSHFKHEDAIRIKKFLAWQGINIELRPGNESLFEVIDWRLAVSKNKKPKATTLTENYLFSKDYLAKLLDAEDSVSFNPMSGWATMAVSKDEQYCLGLIHYLMGHYLNVSTIQIPCDDKLCWAIEVPFGNIGKATMMTAKFDAGYRLRYS